MSKQVNEGQQKREDLKRSIKEKDRAFTEECVKIGITQTVNASDLERQSIKLVSGLVEKFRSIESLLRDKTMQELVQYYIDFTKSDDSAV